MNNDVYLTDRQVAKRYRVSRATIWRWGATGRFPHPIKLGENCTRWKLADLEKWEQSREQVA